MKLKLEELYSSENGKYIVGGSNTEEAFIWNIGNKELLNRFKIKFDCGGNRLAIDNDGKHIASAEYSKGGVTLYSVETGEETWNLKQISIIRNIRFIGNKEILAVTSNDGIVYWVNVNGGDIFGSMNNCKKILDNIEDLMISIDNSNELIFNDKHLNIKGNYLAGTITSQGVVVSKSGGGLYCFDNDGNSIWNQNNSKNEHIIKLAYKKCSNYICGLIYKYNSPRKEPFYKLSCYNANNGELVYENDLDNGIDFVFVEGGNKILSTTGNLYSIEDNEISLLSNIRNRNRN